MEQETSTLILSTYDIDTRISPSSLYQNTTLDNQYGTIANNRCTLTWKNINMRQVLGEMYDKYETFNLYLYQISQSANGIPASAQYLLVDVNITGLPFINNTYNVFSQNNTSRAYLTSYVLNSNTVTPMYNPAIIQFAKNSENINITIDMKCTRDRTYPIINANTCFGHFNFMFKFYGIQTRPQNLITNGSRM